ncbi:MAG: hypothetical protein R2838_03485 [Caldilineaceae bacterium]
MTENASVAVLGDTVASICWVRSIRWAKRCASTTISSASSACWKRAAAAASAATTRAFVPIEGVAQGRLLQRDVIVSSYIVSTISVHVKSSDRIDATEVLVEQTLRACATAWARTTPTTSPSANCGRRAEMVSDVTSTLTVLLGSIGGHQPAGGRHRHHEHHARLGDGAHPGDRSAQGRRTTATSSSSFWWRR